MPPFPLGARAARVSKVLGAGVAAGAWAWAWAGAAGLAPALLVDLLPSGVGVEVGVERAVVGAAAGLRTFMSAMSWVFFPEGGVACGRQGTPVIERTGQGLPVRRTLSHLVISMGYSRQVRSSLPIRPPPGGKQ